MSTQANLRRYRAALLGRGLCGLALMALSAPAFAAGRPTISVGPIKSEKQCQVYEESAGSSASIETRHVLVSADSWRTWLVKDCKDNFASVRTSLEAALASSGKFTVVPHGGAYTLTGAISDVGEGGAPVDPAHATNGFSIQSANMFVNMDVELHDAAGRTIYGGLFTKAIETSSSVSADGFSTSSSQSGQALYGELQHQVALGAARIVAFHIDPLRVTGVDGSQITLNYGAPLLTLGTMVQMQSPDAAAVVKYNVTSAGPDTSQAELYGDGDPRIVPGSTGTVVEGAEANTRRYRKVDLP